MKASPLANLAQQEKTRREILHKSDLIPPLPELVVRLLALLNKRDTEPKELELHLQNDQVLVATGRDSQEDDVSVSIVKVVCPLFPTTCPVVTPG